MKKRGLFVSLAFAFVLGVGTSIGISKMNKAEIVDADVPASPSYTYYFTNSLGWGDVRAHMWTDNEEETTAWPGVEMSFSFVNEQNEDVYSVTFSSSWAPKYIIFNNNGGAQTHNITIGEDCAWYLTGDWPDGKANTAAWQFTPDKVVIAGSHNEWNTSDDDWALSLTNGVWSLSKDMLAGNSFKFTVTTGEQLKWVNYGDGLTSDQNKLGQTPTTDFTWDDGNIKCLRSGNYTFRAINGLDSFKDKTLGVQIVNNSVATYSLFANGDELEDAMEYSGGNVTATVSVAGGDTISIKKDGDTLLGVTPNDGAGNNLSEDLEILIAGEHQFTFSPFANTLWVDGYVNMHKFIAGKDDEGIDGFLRDTISGGTCANPTLIDRWGNAAVDSNDVWHYYSAWFHDFNDDEVFAFQSAIDAALAKGLPLSDSDREDELLEAAERYIWLMEKWNGQGVSEFANATGPVHRSAAVSPLTQTVNSTDNAFAVSILVTSIAAIAAFGAFSLIKRRRIG